MTINWQDRCDLQHSAACCPMALNTAEIIELALLGISVFLLIGTTVIVGSTGVFHKNLRILLIILCTAFTINNSVRATVQAIKHSCNVTDDEDDHVVLYVMNRVRYTADRFVTSTFLLIVFERVYATLNVQEYEKRMKGILWTGLIILVAVLSGAIPSIIIFVSKDWLIPGILYVLVAACLQTVLSAFAYCMNRKLREPANTLTMKYQIEENIRATGVLLPLSAIWLLCQFLTLVYFIGQKEEYEYRRKLKPAYHLTQAAYTIVFCCVLLCTIPKYRNFLRGQLGMREPRNSRVLSLQEQQEMYFAEYSKAWGSEQT